MEKITKLEHTIEIVNFRNIQEAEINPQIMSDKDFKRLVNSIKQDKILTSLPLIVKYGENKYQCISGHHRIKAAKKAGLKQSECIVIKDIDESTKIRLQLTHNDIHGEPDQILVNELKQKLHEEDLKLIDEGAKKLTEEKAIEYEEPLYQYVHICLMPETEKEFTQLFENLQLEESKKYLFEKKEYLQLKKCLTLAFEKGYKTPGKAIRRMLDIYIENEK